MSLRLVALLLLVLAALVTGCAQPTAEQPAQPDSEALIEPFLERVTAESVVSQGRDTNLNADVWEVTIQGETVTLYAFADEAGVQDAIMRMTAMHLWSDDQYVVTYAGENEALITLMNGLFP
jgi:uncharacterized lipoprotein YajG